MLSGSRNIIRFYLQYNNPLEINKYKSRFFFQSVITFNKNINNIESNSKDEILRLNNEYLKKSNSLEKTQFDNHQVELHYENNHNGNNSEIGEVLENINITSDIIDVNSFTLTPEEESKINQYDIESDNVLEDYDKNVSHIHSQVPVTQTLSGYANKSISIQKLIDLGVHLYKWEYRDDLMQFFVNLDYETQLKKYILFFHETAGVPMEEMGAMITRCPFILKENLENMNTRIEYLKYKKFTDDQISSIITRHPQWLMYKVDKMDERLGYFQNSFQLTGDEVRTLCTKLPKVITKKKKYLLEVTFSVYEQMGFTPKETKSILLSHPRIWTQPPDILTKTFDYVHTTMKIPHDLILKFPNILTSRLFRIQSRHQYLKALNRNQYDPCKPLYVSLKALIEGTDAEFCTNVAKTTVESYNLYLKCTNLLS